MSRSAIATATPIATQHDRAAIDAALGVQHPRLLLARGAPAQPRRPPRRGRRSFGRRRRAQGTSSNPARATCRRPARDHACPPAAGAPRRWTIRVGEEILPAREDRPHQPDLVRRARGRAPAGRATAQASALSRRSRNRRRRTVSDRERRGIRTRDAAPQTARRAVLERRSPYLRAPPIDTQSAPPSSWALVMYRRTRTRRKAVSARDRHRTPSAGTIRGRGAVHERHARCIERTENEHGAAVRRRRRVTRRRSVAHEILSSSTNPPRPPRRAW